MWDALVHQRDAPPPCAPPPCAPKDVSMAFGLVVILWANLYPCSCPISDHERRCPPPTTALPHHLLASHPSGRTVTMSLQGGAAFLRTPAQSSYDTSLTYAFSTCRHRHRHMLSVYVCAIRVNNYESKRPRTYTEQPPVYHIYRHRGATSLRHK